MSKPFQPSYKGVDPGRYGDMVVVNMIAQLPTAGLGHTVPHPARCILLGSSIFIIKYCQYKACNLVVNSKPDRLCSESMPDPPDGSAYWHHSELYQPSYKGVDLGRYEDMAVVNMRAQLPTAGLVNMRAQLPTAGFIHTVPHPAQCIYTRQ
jgi:hypothetical protein